jgi:hypothetical protein
VRRLAARAGSRPGPIPDAIVSPSRLAQRRPLPPRPPVVCAPYLTPSLLNNLFYPANMQSLARQAVAPAMRQSFRRSFASSAARAQAVPTEKPVLMKEFKIYRWVSIA